MTEPLRIDEHIRADSQVVRTYAALDGDRVRISVDVSGTEIAGGLLPVAVVVQVMRRYARPLDDEVGATLSDAPRIELGGGIALARLHWRAVVDADGRDWLVLIVPGEPPQAALATGVAAALAYLIERLSVG